MKKVSLVSIYVVDYKSIKELTAQVDGKHFIISGHNGAGKTSLFETINRSAARIDPKEMADIPIRIGSKKAEHKMVYHIDDNGSSRRILVSNIIRPSGQEMTVFDIDKSEELRPPIARLLELLGESKDFTPLIDMSGKEQFEFILKALMKGESFADLQTSVKNKVSMRRQYKSDLKALEAVLKNKTPDHSILMDAKVKGLYLEPKEIPEFNDETSEQLSELGIKKVKVENAKTLLAGYISERDALLAKITELDSRIEAGEKFIADNSVDDSDYVEISEKAEANKKAYQAQKAEIVAYNENVTMIKEYNKQKVVVDEADKKLKAVETEIREFQDKMRTNLMELNLSSIVPELELVYELDEDGEVTRQGIFYGELPFNRRQISYGKSLISLAKLSAFFNAGKLNLFHIPAWESLDEESRTDILEFAENNKELNIQFGIEEVSSEEFGLRLLDGVE